MATQDPKVSIHFHEDFIGIEDHMNDSTSYKTTNLENIQRAFSTSRPLETPWLPGHWGTQKYLQRGDRHLFVLTEPARQGVNVSFERGDSNKNYTIPVPSTLWIVVADGDPNDRLQLRQSYVYALGGNPILSEEDHVYKFPFGNVYGDNRICWGTHHVELGGSKSVMSIPTRFWGASFNNDLDSESSHRFEDIERTHHLFDHLQDQYEEFPHNKLRRYMTINDALQRAINQNM